METPHAFCTFQLTEVKLDWCLCVFVCAQVCMYLNAKQLIQFTSSRFTMGVKITIDKK